MRCDVVFLCRSFSSVQRQAQIGQGLGQVVILCCGYPCLVAGCSQFFCASAAWCSICQPLLGRSFVKRTEQRTTRISPSKKEILFQFWCPMALNVPAGVELPCARKSTDAAVTGLKYYMKQAGSRYTDQNKSHPTWTGYLLGECQR